MKKRKNYILLLLLLCQTVVWAQGTDRVAAIREKLFNPDSKDVLVVSHRGDWRNACENSVEAVRNASRMGVDIVEIDLGRTKDGELIVMLPHFPISSTNFLRVEAECPIQLFFPKLWLILWA